MPSSTYPALLAAYMRAAAGRRPGSRVGPFAVGLDAHSDNPFRNFAVPDENACPDEGQVSALIDFMNLVYHQLNLASKYEMEQPHNEGWLKIFRHWVRQPDFKETWDRGKQTYEPRFQDFYNHLNDKET